MATNHAEAATTRTALVTIGPSRLVRMTVGPMTKILNPVIRRLAGRPHFRMAALIRHVGRRSGRLNGVDYEATAPEVVNATEAGPVVRPAFGPLVRASFRMLGIRQFLLLRLADCESG